MATFNSMKEYVDAMRARLVKMTEERRRDAILTALDAIALVQLRIRTEGKDADGADFVPYDPVYEKSKFAEFNNSFVDFTRTGSMLNSLTPEIIEETIEFIRVEIKPNNQSDQTKLNAHEKKWGNILRLSEEELQFVLQAWRDRRLKHLTDV